MSRFIAGSIPAPANSEVSMISDYRGKHRGESVAILGNGPSLTDHPIDELKCVTIGLNQSWRVCESHYHVVVEMDQYDRFEKELRLVPKLFSIAPKPFGELMQPITAEPHHLRWSWDLEEGVYVKTVGYVALQLAVYMRFQRIYLIGFDCGPRDERDHFHDDSGLLAWPEPAHREVLGFAAGVLSMQAYIARPEVFLVGRSASCAFPHISWEDIR